MQTKVSEYFSLISKKKGLCRLTAAPVDVLPHGLGTFGHELEVELQKKKKDHRLVIAASIEVLPHGSGTFDMCLRLNSKKWSWPVNPYVNACLASQIR